MNELLRGIGFAVCHQLPSHSLVCQGHPMPLCARCTGIYTALFLTAAFLLAGRRLRRGGFPSSLVVALGLGYFAAMAADVVTALLGWRETGNGLRLATGALVGVALPVLGLPLANSLVRERGGEEGRILSGWAFLGISGGMLALAVAAKNPPWFLFSLLSLVSLLGLLLFLFAINVFALSALWGAGKVRIALGSLALSGAEWAALTGLHRWLLPFQGGT